ncbi:amidohydrolase family protein [Agromyces mediolanus]|uniref:N-acyl-D-amino-acid deacylase family protein n=1 Tax=Agromyces mediolanus TaxID=41986 RepID=UPI00203C7E2F|nr:amidohydrolase family protein [Agromyces mediolanus]MCM3658714.1 amidohydrolase family protein [Agromyces mediolanus]
MSDPRSVIRDVRLDPAAEPVDLVLDGELLAAVRPRDERGAPAGRSAAHEIAGEGRLVLPGFVDAHSHADARLFDPEVQLALLRQGVTSVIGGQDGVGFAPGDGAYGSEYFAAINGRHPGDAGGGIAGLLAGYDGTTPLNAGVLVPAGTVRHEVLGRSAAPATAEELAAMRALVRAGLDEGALGLSSGLDYVPGIFADVDELAELAMELGRAGGVYVSHLRGGYEANSAAGVAELAEIGRRSGAPVHVSHFHAEPAIVHALMAELAEAGLDASFDAYPYGRGCSLLAMPLLPPEFGVRPADELVGLLADERVRAELLRDWFPGIADYPSLGPAWPEMLVFGHLAAAELDWAHGLTLAEASARAGRSPAEFALDALVASRLEVNVVMAVQRERSAAELAGILAHPRAMGGSDGIFVGRHPHPRARGSFARYPRELVLEHGVLDWAGLAAFASTRAAERFGLGRRGRVQAGSLADLVLLDPATVRDTASYDAPLGLAEGIEDVLVAGVPVLAGGRLTGATPGRGLRRAASPAAHEGSR